MIEAPMMPPPQMTIRSSWLAAEAEDAADMLIRRSARAIGKQVVGSTSRDEMSRDSAIVRAPAEPLLYIQAPVGKHAGACTPILVSQPAPRRRRCCRLQG
jgi:hypothetical protein